MTEFGRLGLGDMCFMVLYCNDLLEMNLNQLEVDHNLSSLLRDSNHLLPFRKLLLLTFKVLHVFSG